jgi:hypothetical protein
VELPDNENALPFVQLLPHNSSQCYSRQAYITHIDLIYNGDKKTRKQFNLRACGDF